MNKWIFVFATVAGLSAHSPSDRLMLTDTSAVEISCLYNELEVAKQELKCYEDLLQVNSKKTKSNKVKHKHRSRIITEFKKQWNTVFHLDAGVNMSLKDKLGNALNMCPYDGRCIITSGLRPQCTSSQHSKGEAVDVSWRRHGKDFGKWLLSNDGEIWLKSNGLSFYFENVSSKKDDSHYFYNKARFNGEKIKPHIHLYILK